MKKFLVIAILTIMVLSLAGCGSKNDGSKGSKETVSTVESTQRGTSIASNPAADNFIPATSSEIPNYATISILPEIKLENTDAWLGLCPAGVDYITELEADEVDIIYFYPEWKENPGDKTVYACDFEPVEDGTYALVVCTSDDENVGYVIIQMNVTKKDGKMNFDLEHAQFKEKPKK